MRQKAIAVVACLVLAAACGGGPVEEAGLPAADHPTPDHTASAPEHPPTHVPTSEAAQPSSVVTSPEPWIMFHGDESHTGLVDGVGSVDPASGPSVRWTFEAAPAAISGADLRWFSTFPLGDLDGDGTLEVVVTTPDNRFGLNPRVIALKDAPGEPGGFRELWTYTIDNLDAGVDQYGAALADADGDGLLDVIFSARDGFVRAVKGNTGELLWQYGTGRIMEAGPMIADLEGDGSLEVIQTTDCLLGGCPPGGAIYVFAADPSGDSVENEPLWTREFPWKADSGEAVIADLDPDDGEARKAIVMTSWGGQLIVLWRDASGEIVQNELDLKTLDPTIPADSHSVVIRSSPLAADFGEGLEVVFGWMPDWKDYTRARLSAIGLQADMAAGTVEFNPRWTEMDIAWKSSPAFVPNGEATPLVVTGVGYAINPDGGFACDRLYGGVVARDGLTGELVWEHIVPDGQGDVRSSAAVADVDGDGRLEVIIGVGCGGGLLGLDALTGAVEWELQLGAQTYVSPSIGDLDGDGRLEIVVGSYDGKVYVLEGRPDG